jgi:hypothetical protein
MNEQQNTREAFDPKLFAEYDEAARTILGLTDEALWAVKGPTEMEYGFKCYLAGAASVDRVEIVEKFEKVKESIITHIQVHDSCHDHACPTHQKLESALAEMDAVIAAIEKGK